jgi:hypothetical protein
MYIHTTKITEKPVRNPVRTQSNHRKKNFPIPNSFQNLAFSIVLAYTFLLLNFNHASAQVTCPAAPRWLETTPPINADHIFCGEVKRGKAKGFHSRPGGVNPSTVENFVITQQPNANGVYTGTLTLVSPKGSNPSKFSTMFPDSCTKAQVVESVLYAQANSEPCPAGAPKWASCGMNRPATDDGKGYCIGDDAKSRFTIAFAILGKGNINTAFPLR